MKHTAKTHKEFLRRLQANLQAQGMKGGPVNHSGQPVGEFSKAYMEVRYPRLAKAANIHVGKPTDPKAAGAYEPMFGNLKRFRERTRQLDAETKAAGSKVGFKEFGHEVGKLFKGRPEPKTTILPQAGLGVLAHELRHVADFRKKSVRKVMTSHFAQRALPYGLRPIEVRAFKTGSRFPGHGAGTAERMLRQGVLSKRVATVAGFATGLAIRSQWRKHHGKQTATTAA